MKSFFILIAFGFINFISWNFYGSFFIINIVLLFFFLEVQDEKKVYLKVLLSFVFLLVFNLTSIFWLFTVDGYNAFLILIANAILYLPIFVAYYFFNNKYKRLLFVAFYVGFEVIYSIWDLAFPWLSLGHVMGNQWYLVEWYSVFGSYGGSLWLLCIGWCLYEIIVQNRRVFYISFSIGLMFPVLSLIQYANISYDNLNTEKIDVLAYNPVKKSTKYNTTKSMYRTLNNIQNIDFIVTPELFYTGLYPSELKQGIYTEFFDFYHKKNPNTNFIIGTELINNHTIRFNGVATLSQKETLFRTKKKYVPIREFTPSFFSAWYPSYYVKNKNDDENKITNSLNIFPLVCYESIFSSFVASKSLNAKALFLLTSEHFMNGSDFGKKQYLNIVRIRAIENNKSILKVADDGISCIFLPNGKIESYLSEEIEQVQIKLFPKQSIYSKIISIL
ncbi:nitrilase-related carbon-nitrogen hydrolase [Winogradskyella forsetii]|uniref:nitrilase-related carbon-nitrogen hydrolase n=1 Tax=Winogradskyella forsetii TaxID=2686077 RepID=UPI0015BDEF4D|nr:nitrilase-related carbon-nitrogen hydrolase [Winogradskyella forsetii]